MILLVVKAAGASKVLVADVRENRLKTAKNVGADEVLDVTDLAPSEIATSVSEIFQGKPDVTFECTGANSCMETGILVSLIFKLQTISFHENSYKRKDEACIFDQK